MRLRIGALVVIPFMLCAVAFWQFQVNQWHNRDNLPEEFQEVFATPLDKVDISEYWNSSSGHGTRFSFLFHSTDAIEIKDESKYEKIEVRDKHRYPWATTALYREKRSGDVTILLDQSRRSGHVYVHTPIKVALMRDGQRLRPHLPWPNALTQVDKAWNERWAKQEEAKGFQFYNFGPHNSVISISHIVDPRKLTPEEFELKIRKYLSELDGYSPHDVPEKVSDKLLEIHVPDCSLSEAQVQTLSKIATELSSNYAEPFDGKVWRTKSRNGAIPIRLTIYVEVESLKD